MRRFQLFEFCDQPWLPEILRAAETNYLATAIAVGQPFAPLAPKIAAAMAAARTDRIVDLAAGGAGPWPSLAAAIASHGPTPKITLTDLYPNTAAYARIGYAYELASVDARRVPARLAGVRTMFDALHHLRPDDARAVLADAHRARQPIVIGEAVSRTVPTLLTTLLVPLLVLLLTPKVRPRSLAALVFTYLIPILPLAITWDGIVSCLRTYTPRELEALAQGLDGYAWDAGYVRHRGATVTYLVGTPLDDREGERPRP